MSSDSTTWKAVFFRNLENLRDDQKFLSKFEFEERVMRSPLERFIVKGKEALNYFISVEK